jgi:hypothetical protein
LSEINYRSFIGKNQAPEPTVKLELWGRIEEGTLGWRAEKALIKQILLDCYEVTPQVLELGSRLESSYEVPVSCVQWRAKPVIKLRAKPVIKLSDFEELFLLWDSRASLNDEERVYVRKKLMKELTQRICLANLLVARGKSDTVAKRLEGYKKLLHDVTTAA